LRGKLVNISKERKKKKEGKQCEEPERTKEQEQWEVGSSWTHLFQPIANRSQGYELLWAANKKGWTAERQKKSLR